MKPIVVPLSGHTLLKAVFVCALSFTAAFAQELSPPSEKDGKEPGGDGADSIKIKELNVKGPVQAAMVGHVFRPEQKEPTPELISQLKLPPGFEISVFAKGLERPRMMAVGPNGDVYVTRRDPHNDVLRLSDKDGDGKAEAVETVIKQKHSHGIAIRDGYLYLAAVRELFRAPLKEDGGVGKLETIFDDLPDAGQHPNRTIRFGPDGKAYLSVGSTCNACAETNDENATLLQVNLEDKSRRIFASGLRNTIGFDWHPETGDLYGMDHGIDWLGDEEQPEELNLIQEGKKYGWPYVYANGKPNPADLPPKGKTWDEWAKESVDPVLLYEAHAAPMDLVFYRGDQFPEEFRNSAFVTFHGSWNKKKPSGYNVAVLKFEKGKPVKFVDFITGFLIDDNKARFGRPCGLVLAKDGSLLMSDDDGGVVYRITYKSKN